MQLLTSPDLSKFDTDRAAGFILAVVVAICFGYGILAGFQYGAVGTHDFIEYWTAYRAVVEGLNPYLPEVVGPMQQELGKTGEPLMYWGPPWLLSLLTPILELPFETAARMWFLLNVGFLVLASVLTAHFYCPERRWFCALIGVTSIPAIHCLYLGQVSLLLAAAVALLLIGIEKQRVVTGALGLALLSIKPHLFLLLAVFIGWRAIRQRAVTLPAIGVGWLAILCLLTLALMPGSLGSWIQTFWVEPAGVTSRLHWRTATVASSLGNLLTSEPGGPPGWPLVVIPLSAAMLLGLGLALDDPPKKFADRKLFHSILPASLSFAPFGWFFDSSVLVSTQVALSTGSNTDLMKRSLRPGFVLVLLGLQGLAAASVLVGLDHHELVWFPLSILCVAIVQIWIDRARSG